MTMMRWGMRTPPRAGGYPVTNIRNTSSPLPCPGQQLRRDAPEPNPETGKKDVVWFALSEDRPLFAFAGMWTTFNGDRGTPATG